MTLDLSSLQKAVSALDRSINSYSTNQDNKSLSDADKETLKSGVIQNFEVAYELCWKFMKRWLEENAGGEVVNALTIKELFRMSFEHVLIKDIDAWFGYQKARNLASHTYNASNADKAFEAATKFIFDAKELLNNLERKND